MIRTYIISEYSMRNFIVVSKSLRADIRIKPEIHI